MRNMTVVTAVLQHAPDQQELDCNTFLHLLYCALWLCRCAVLALQREVNGVLNFRVPGSRL